MRDRIALGVRQSGGTAAMLTLTAGQAPSWSQVMVWWGRFRQRVVKLFGGFEYAAVKEVGGGGSKHLHVIVTGWRFIAQRVLSALWRKATKGAAYVVDVRRVDENAAGYVSKYVSKAVGADRDLRKLVTYSRGWPKVEAEASSWSMVEVSAGPDLPRSAANAQVVGTRYVALNRGCECVDAATPQTMTHALYLLRLAHLARYGPGWQSEKRRL